jgi:hypothetical protein
MRILVAASPKTGNVWIKHILAALYDLRMLDPIPGRSALELKDFVNQKQFRDRSIFHQHFDAEPELFEAMKPVAPYVVTTNRNPYDTFVSLYFFAQRHKDAFPEAHPVSMMVGKPVEHPDVLTYLAEHFPHQLYMTEAWMDSGKSIMVSYEDLYNDPYATVERVAKRIKAAPMGAIRKAVDASSADVLKKRGGYWNVHIRTATVGDWQSTLTDKHLKILRDNHADVIRKIGYEVA